MPFIFCNLNDKEDSSQFCYVNKDGRHVSPRQCTCKDYNPPAKERQYKNFPAIPHPDGQHTVPTSVFKNYLLKTNGKMNPNCPIEDPHEPIDKSWKV